MVADALSCLSSLCAHLRKRSLLSAAQKVGHLATCSASVWRFGLIAQLRLRICLLATARALHCFCSTTAWRFAWLPFSQPLQRHAAPASGSHSVFTFNIWTPPPQVAPLLQHYCTAVRAAAVRFVSTASAALPPADVHTRLRPLVSSMFVREPLSFCDPVLLARCLYVKPLASLESPLASPAPPQPPAASAVGLGMGMGAAAASGPSERSADDAFGGGGGGVRLQFDVGAPLHAAQWHSDDHDVSAIA